MGSVQMTIGPWPRHDVVLMAVRKAVSAATITFTANSMIRCFFIRFSFFSVVRWRGGQPLSRLKARDASGGDCEINKGIDLQNTFC